MTNRIASLLEQAKALTPEERAELLAELHDLVTPPDPDWEKAWADECERRLRAYERGETVAEDADVVMARLRAKHLPG